mgnify:CR=1 FL=1
MINDLSLGAVTIQSDSDHTIPGSILTLDMSNLSDVDGISEILSYKVKDLDSLENLKTFLGKVPAGNSRIKLFLNIDSKLCEINLPDNYAIDINHKEELSRINGIESIG